MNDKNESDGPAKPGLLKMVWTKGATFIDRTTKWAVLIAVIHYVWHYEQDRRNEAWATIYRAWQKPGDGGRVHALGILARCREELCHIDLSHAHLGGVDLTGANLHGANFCDASLEGAILKGAILTRTNLGGVDLRSTVGLEPNQVAEANWNSKTRFPKRIEDYIKEHRLQGVRAAEADHHK